MNKNIKKYLKKFLIIKAVLIVSVIVSLFIWETWVRTPAVEMWNGEEVVFQRPAAEPTEFELWLASQDVKDELDLMFKRHQRDLLNMEITEIESKR